MRKDQRNISWMTKINQSVLHFMVAKHSPRVLFSGLIHFHDIRPF
jgi:hypothetical protein